MNNFTSNIINCLLNNKNIETAIEETEFYPEVQQNLKIKTAQSICTVS